MSKQPTIFFFGVLFCIGLLIQIITSSIWNTFENQKLAEAIFYLGQAIGELCYIFGCRKLFRGLGFFVAVTEFAISLVLVDIVTILFLNPNEISLSKYIGFCVASFVLLLRMKQYRKQNE